MDIKITFLGTGTSHGIPMLLSDHPVSKSEHSKDKRLRSSVFVRVGGKAILIDCGPDFRQQMLRASVDKIDAVLITHEHADHIAGLDDIRPFCYQRKAPMPIYGLPRVLESLEKRYDYIFEKVNRYPGAPEVDCFPLDMEPFFIENIKVEPIQVMHGPLPILGYKFNNFAYLTDVKTLPERSINQLKNIDTLVISALRIAPHFSHVNLEEALALIDEIQPKRAYFTHISHHLGFHDEVTKTLPNHVNLAYDGLELTVD